MLDETYRPGAYHNFVVREPAVRKISAAPFRERGCECTGRCAPDKLASPDRVVHHALCQVVEPLFERTLLPPSFANRVGMGRHRAMDRCAALVRRHPYVLKADVSKFFPSVDHEILYLFGDSKPAPHEARRRIETFLPAVHLDQACPSPAGALVPRGEDAQVGDLLRGGRAEARPPLLADAEDRDGVPLALRRAAARGTDVREC